jgi:hypothetical protein
MATGMVRQAVVDTEGPAVPWAGDNVALQSSLSQWSSSVRTNVVNGVELSLDIEHRNGLVAMLDEFACAQGHVRYAADWRETGKHLPRIISKSQA